jgi:hypothetical protein
MRCIVHRAGVNVGDVWYHKCLENSDGVPPLVPFHKLSQWLTYSLLEPLQELGLSFEGFQDMTGLPEYRNGGLLIDLGLLSPKPGRLDEIHTVDSEFIVEWRASTIVLLDSIAEALRKKWGMDSVSLPLVKV